MVSFMDKKLLQQALFKFFVGFAGVTLLVFLPAGTLRFWYGWLLMLVLFVPMLAAGFIMFFKSPELLRRRLKAREQEGEQKTVILLSGLMFLGAFVLAGLNYRFGWLPLPKWAAVLAAAVFLLGYALFGEVLRENVWLSRTVEVQEGQKVVDKGLYGIVRHPMYAATVLMFLAMPLILGSPLSFLIMLLYPFLLRKRIRNEEELLETELEGYTDYKKRVRWKVLPYIW